MNGESQVSCAVLSPHVPGLLGPPHWGVLMCLFRTDSCHSMGRRRPGRPERPPRSDIRKEPLMVRAFLPKAVLLLVLALFLALPIQAAGTLPTNSAARGILIQVW